MSENEPNAGTRSAFSWPAIIGALAVIGVGLLPALHDANMKGVSELLALVYLVGWGAILCRHLIHIAEGYYRVGLRRPMLFELGAVGAVGVLAWLAYLGEDPDIPRLLACSGVGSLLFFLATGRLEEARAALNAREDAESVRRASDAIRATSLWGWLCRRVGQLPFKSVEQVRAFFRSPDTRDGQLSLVAAITVLAMIALALISTGLAVASLVFPLQITPERSQNERARTEKREKRRDDPGREVAGDGEGIADGTAVIGEDCHDLDRGSAVPEPERSALMRAWVQVDGVPPGPMEALGYEIAGCPGPARQIPGLPGSWYRPGYCDGRLQAVAIAPQGMDHPVVLLEQAADFALPLIRKGEFLSATNRFPVMDGDAYIVDGRDGSHVLFRDRTTDGPVENGAEARSGCGGLTDYDVRYTVSGPGLIEVWRSVATISPGGVYPIDFAGGDGDAETVAFRSPEGIVAEGACSIETMTCMIDISPKEIEGRGARISESEVKALVEP